MELKDNGVTTQKEYKMANPVAATGQGKANTKDAQDSAMNPTVDLHNTDDEIIKEFIRKHGTIGLDCYVPNFSNT